MGCGVIDGTDVDSLAAFLESQIFESYKTTVEGIIDTKFELERPILGVMQRTALGYVFYANSASSGLKGRGQEIIGEDDSAEGAKQSYKDGLALYYLILSPMPDKQLGAPDLQDKKTLEKLIIKTN